MSWLNLKIALLVILMGFMGLSMVLSVYSATGPSQPRHLQISFVDTHEIWESLPVLQTLKGELEHILQEYHQELTMTEKELKSEHLALLEAQKHNISPEQSKALEGRKAKFEALVIETQKNVEAKQKSINKRHQQAIDKVQEILEDTVQKIAKEKNISAVFTKKQVLYASPPLDLTAVVREKVKVATQHIHIAPEV